MRIAVCIKQVVDCHSSFSAKGGVTRTADNSIMNPADLLALETAVSLKRTAGAHLSVFTMGPPWADKVLWESAK